MQIIKRNATLGFYPLSVYIYSLGMVRTTVMSLSFELDINSKIHEKLMRIINVMQVQSVRAIKFYMSRP